MCACDRLRTAPRRRRAWSNRRCCRATARRVRRVPAPAPPARAPKKSPRRRPSDTTKKERRTPSRRGRARTYFTLLTSAAQKFRSKSMANGRNDKRGGKQTKFILVTGGVVSSLGKGLASASIGALLEN